MAEDDEELTHGEIGRTLKRLERGQRDADDRLTRVAAEMVPSSLFANTIQALQKADADLAKVTTERFEQVEKTSLERRAALQSKDRDLDKKIGAIETRLDSGENRKTARAANWIAFSLLLLTAIGLVVTIATVHGGR